MLWVSGIMEKQGQSISEHMLYQVGIWNFDK